MYVTFHGPSLEQGPQNEAAVFYREKGSVSRHITTGISQVLGEVRQ